MNRQNNRLIFYKPVLIVFVLVNIACAIIKFTSLTLNTDWKVIFGTNLLLLVISVIGITKQLTVLKINNPYAMVRGVMMSMVMKFFILGTAAFTYLYLAGAERNVNALFISMGVYLIYTWVEVKITMQLKPPIKNGGN